MTGRIVFLGLLAICLAADAEEKSGLMRKPSCSEVTLVCSKNLDPVCGSDGQTYGNECMLCMKRQKTKEDILIVRKGFC